MVASVSTAKVALANDFLSSLTDLPKKQQVKVIDFINKFRTNPEHPSINLEKLQRAKDPNIRSVRIDQAYRGIVLRPEKGNVFLLLHVDHHDEAYRWAENRVFPINPETGSIQCVDIQVAGAAGSQAETQMAQADAGLKPAETHQESIEKKPLFADLWDRDLIQFGVPELLIPLIRSIRTDTEFESAASQLPGEAYESLLMLATGSSVEEVYQELEKSRESSVKVDTTDYAAALENPDTKRRFYVVEDELELAAILSEPMEKWRVFLHPSQRKLVERDWNGPVRVLGGAGTGKTVAAIHRARWLAQNVFTGPHDRILFTTFTRNLAEDIQQNLGKICSSEVMKRIEVVNIDRWVSDFLKRNGYRYEIDYNDRVRDLWKKALDRAPELPGLSLSFYREEWEQVIQPQEITTVEEYMKASRVGRGVKLDRKQRRPVWAVFEEYRVLLNEHGVREADDAFHDARILLEKKGSVLPYKAIIVDEAQDMGAQIFKLLRAMLPGGDQKNDMFIVGDAHQRIYRQKVHLNRCGINVRGRSRKLRINYRTTEETRKWAVGILEGVCVDDLDGGIDTQKGYKSLLHGEAPTVRYFDSYEDEVNFIETYLKKLENDGVDLRQVCLVVRTNALLKQYEKTLKEKNFPVHLIKRSQPEDQKIRGLRLATMHRVKGLEFDYVIAASVNKDVVPLKVSDDEIFSSSLESENRERALLHVAATRARKELLVTSYGERSPFV